MMTLAIVWSCTGIIMIPFMTLGFTWEAIDSGNASMAAMGAVVTLVTFALSALTAYKLLTM